jgi:ribosomal protein S14
MWEKVRRDNHCWDCEVMQLLAVKLIGLWTENPVMGGLEQAEQIPAAIALPEAVQPSKPSEIPVGDRRCPGCGSRGMYQKNNVWMCPVCDKDMEDMNE